MKEKIVYDWETWVLAKQVKENNNFLCDWRTDF